MLPRNFKVCVADHFDPCVFDTEESFRAVARIHFDATAELYRERGGIAPMTCNYCLRDPVTRTPGPAIYVISMERGNLGPREAKERLAAATRFTRTAGQAICSVLVSEVWGVRAKSEEDAERIRALGNLTSHPEKIGGVLVRVRHERWSAVGFAVVGPSGLEPWKINYDPKAYRGSALFEGWP